MDIQTFDGFFTAEECAELRTLIEGKDAVNFTDTGKFTNKKWVDAELATRMWSRLREFTDRDDMLRPNNLVMAGIYVAGDSFGLHTDTGLFYDRERREKSRWTLLVYLNEDFSGGETVFYDVEAGVEACRVQPVAGRALIFDIDLWHCGSPILSGKKSWIGCEIIGAFKPTE